MSLPRFLDISQSILQENQMSVAFPGGTSFSFPVLIIRNGLLLDAMFLCGGDTEASEAERPSSWIMLNSKTGEVALYADCRVMDFMPPGSLAVGSRIRLEYPLSLNSRQYAQSYNQLYLVYEQIREFVFSPEPSQTQRSLMERYRKLFLQLVPQGLYPYYAGLAPEFFIWLGLPEEKAEFEVNKKEFVDLDPAAGTVYSLSAEAVELQSRNSIQEGTVLSAVRDLEEGIERGEELATITLEALRDLTGLVGSLQDGSLQILQALRLLAEHQTREQTEEVKREQIIDRMHQELTDYRNGMLDRLTEAMELDVIRLIDDVARSLEAYQGKNATKENYRKLLALLEGVETDLCDILYRQGLEPYSIPGDMVDIQKQKVLATMPTDNQALDKTTAQRHARGWEKNGRTVRREQISVYVTDGKKESQNGSDAAAGGGK